MELLSIHYRSLEERILRSLKASDVRHRTEYSTGIWLGPLVGLCALATILYEDNSYSEICLLVGLTGAGLLVSCTALYARLAMENVAAKDFQVVYFFPAIVTSMLYLIVADKGLLVSVLWGSGVASLGSWGVMQTMSNFQGCFTLGEATAVTHGVILFLLSIVTNLPLRYHLPPIHDNDISTAILQVGILYVMCMCMLCTIFPKMRQTVQFYSAALGLLVLGVIPALHIILDQSPVLWIISFVFGKTSRILLVIYWAVCLLCGLFVIIYQIHSNLRATTTVRKAFHILAVFVYIPGVLWEPTLLYLASGIMLALFVMLELLRKLKLPPMGEFLQQGFSTFVDEKDSLVSLSPLYLLCGLSFPLWMPIENLEVLPLMSGILTVGVGDTAASFFGYRYGQHKWSNTSKSLEGTMACILAQLLMIIGFANFGYVGSLWLLVKSTLSVIFVSLVEARTIQVDNLALPLLMYMCLML